MRGGVVLLDALETVDRLLGSNTPVGQWFHYAMTVDADCNHRLFVNGDIVKPLGHNNGTADD